jgi:hypothetical protein
MTETTQAAATQAANGQAPAQADAPCEDCTNTSERVMGILGVLAAVGLLFIGIDLVTGGALSRALFPAKADDASG